MTTHIEPHSTAYARIVGALYIIIGIFGCLAILYASSHYINELDIASMHEAYRNHIGMAKLEIYGHFAIIITEGFLAVMLFEMFKSVNETLSRIALFTRFGMVFTMATMLFAQLANLQITQGAYWFAGIGKETTLAIAGLLFSFTMNGVVIWQVFFAIHLFILGYLVIRSGRFPKIFGFGMMIGSWGYLLDSFNKIEPSFPIFLSALTGVLLTIVTFAEMGFALWLVIKGQNTGR